MAVGYIYTTKELYKHLAEVMIPLVDKLVERGKLMTDPPVMMPTLPKMPKLEIMSELGDNIFLKDEAAVEEFKTKGWEEIRDHEARVK